MHELPERALTGKSDAQHDPSIAAPYEAQLKFSNSEAEPFGVRLYSDETHWTEIGFDTKKSVFYIDRTKSEGITASGFAVRTEAPLALGRPYDLRLIVDRSSVEVYAQSGTIAMTDLIFPLSAKSTLEIFPASAAKNNAVGHLWELKPIWDASRAGK